MRRREMQPRYLRGFTVVELVLVIVILGVIGALVGPRFFDNAAFDERAYFDELVSSIRYAQKVAVASGCRVRVDIAAGSYSLAQQAAVAGHCDPGDSSYPLAVLLPTGQAVSGTAPAGVLAAPVTTLVYDPLGRSGLAADRAITIGARTLVVQAESGLVSVP